MIITAVNGKLILEKFMANKFFTILAKKIDGYTLIDNNGKRYPLIYEVNDKYRYVAAFWLLIYYDQSDIYKVLHCVDTDINFEDYVT